MSEDLDDELLALVDQEEEGSSHKKQSKRRKPASDSEDEGEPEVESEEDDDGNVQHASSRSAGQNAYPLEGLYKNEKDREEIFALPELEREEVLAARQEEKAKAAERSTLFAFHKTQQGKEDAEEESGAAKKKSAAAGATSERKKKLNELTKKRSEKTKRATKKKRSASPGRESESESSSSEGEHERKEMASSLRAEREKEDKEAISLVDIQSCTLRRGQLIDMLGHPAFEEYVVGSFVRVLAPPLPGQKQGGYLLCEIVAVVDNAKIYSLDRAQSSVQDNRRLTLKHGKAEKIQQMDIISNDAVTQDEFVSWIKRNAKDSILTPGKSKLVARREKHREIKNRKMTDADITANIARKNALGLARSRFQEQQIALNRRRGEYNMALKRQDWDVADMLAEQIRTLEEEVESSRPASGTATPKGTEGDTKAGLLAAAGGDALWQMKERNREVLRLAQEQAKKESANLAAGQRKKAKLEGTTSSQMLQSQPANLDPSKSSSARGIPLPVWKNDRFGFGQVTSTMVLDLGPDF